jgi:hypothetical protein
VSEARTQPPDRPAWMRRSPEVTALALAVVLSQHVGLISSTQAAVVAIGVLLYLSAVIAVEHWHHDLSPDGGGSP